MKRVSTPLLLFVILAALTWFSYNEDLNLYWQSVIMLIGINIILASSLNIVNGYMGEFACGHAGFMAVGAYVSSLISVALFAKDKVFGTPLLDPSLGIWFFPIIILIGGVAAAFAGLLVAIPSFKTRGDYLAIITIAANYIIKSTIENINVIGGARGFMGMGRVTAAFSSPFETAAETFESNESAVTFFEFLAELPWMLIWVFVGAVFTIWIIRRFVSSTYGKGIIAICQDEIAAEIMSVNTNRMKTVAFMLSSGLAGVAGGLFAHMLGYVNPGSFTILKSTECLVMVYLGGMGSLSGSVMAAIFFTMMMEGLRFVIPALNDLAHFTGVLPETWQITQVWKWVMIPLSLIILMQFRPEGIMGNRELSDIFPRLKKFYRFK